MHPKMEVARLLGLDMRVLTKCIRYANISFVRSPDDARKQLFTDDMVGQIREAHVALYGHAPYGDLVAEVEELKRRVARLEANPAPAVRVPLPAPALAPLPRVVRPMPTVRRQESILPPGMVSRSDVADAHGFPLTTLRAWCKDGKVETSPETYGSEHGHFAVERPVTRRGLAQFYALASQRRDNFTPCKECPHDEPVTAAAATLRGSASFPEVEE